MTSVIVVMGWYDNLKDADDLQKAVQQFYSSHLPKGTPLTVTRYDLPISLPPLGDIVLVGFSFGGNAAIVAASKAGTRPIKKLVLIDPVHFPNNNITDSRDNGFDLPDNVKSAWCCFRTTRGTGAPITNYFSAPIRSAKCEFTNFHFIPKIVADINGGQAAEHGQYVWSQTTIDLIKGA